MSIVMFKSNFLAGVFCRTRLSVEFRYSEKNCCYCTHVKYFHWVTFDRRHLCESNVWFFRPSLELGPLDLQRRWIRTSDENSNPRNHWFGIDLLKKNEYEFWLNCSETHDVPHEQKPSKVAFGNILSSCLLRRRAHWSYKSSLQRSHSNWY